MEKKAHVAQWYHMIFYPGWLRLWLEKPQRFLAELVRPGMSAADIGCGLGFYTRYLAQMVGDTGLVYAVDMQESMLNFARRKIRRAGLTDRVEFLQCAENDIKLSQPLDFALTMHVVHEVPDRSRFLEQIRSVLKPQGYYLMCEPKGHCSRELFESILNDATAAGLKKIDSPSIPMGRTALFTTAS